MGQQSTGIRQPGLVRDPSPVLLLRREAADEQEVQSDVLEQHRDNTVAKEASLLKLLIWSMGLLCICRVSIRLLNSLVMPEVTFFVW